MLTEIMPNLYQIEVPLPGTPLKVLNSYLIKADDGCLLIDTGFNRPECKEAVLSAFAELGITPADCDFFLTHLHADHTGLVSELATDSSTIYCSKEDGEGILRFINGNHWEIMGQLLVAHGFPPEILTETIDKHPASKGGINRTLRFTYVEDADTLEIGDFKFDCVYTPGHTPGHICLYEPHKKLFFSGDHILGNITPNITVWPQLSDALVEYLYNLDRVYELDIDLVLPGHRSLIKDCKGRINEIKAHHEKRLLQTLNILSKGSCTAFQAAEQMTWDLSYKSWADFPFPQKWFATGEAAAHLEYLVQFGTVKKEILNDVNIFSLI